MDLRQFIVLDDFDVSNEGFIYTLSHVELLEQSVILFFFVVEMINDRFIEDFFFDIHQRFNIFKADCIF